MTSRDWVIAQAMFLFLKLLKLIPADAATRFIGRGARIVGPLVPRSRVALENLRRAYPDMDEAERQEILRGMWDNLARLTVEYVHLDEIFDFDPDNPGAGRIEVVGADQFIKLLEGGKPSIIFTGHLANWELLPVCAARFGLNVASLFRAPNNRFIADRLMGVRGGTMGEMVASRPGAVYDLMKVLERGGHIGVLVDQKFWHGIRVPFFGHPVSTNPLLGKMARKYECAVHGARTIRLPDGRFRLEITEELDLPRDAEGHVDVEKATALVTAVIEGWVREHPEQWLWAHRRWEL